MPDPKFDMNRSTLDIANDIIESQRKNIVEAHEQLEQLQYANAAWLQTHESSKERIVDLENQVAMLRQQVLDLKVLLNRAHGLITLQNDKNVSG